MPSPSSAEVDLTNIFFSAKEFMNVEQAFNKAAEIALDARDDGIYRVQTDLDKVDLEKLKHPNPDDRPGNCAC